MTGSRADKGAHIGPAFTPSGEAKEESAETHAAAESEPIGPPPEEERAPGVIHLERTDSGQVATFQNLSPKRLTFTISATDAAGNVHSSIQVTALPHKSEVLNDHGLVIMPGDQIRVQSPPYQDFSVSAY